MVQKTRKLGREEMLKTLYEDRRAKGTRLFDFFYTPLNRIFGHQGTSPIMRISKVRPPACSSNRHNKLAIYRSPAVRKTPRTREGYS